MYGREWIYICMEQCEHKKYGICDHAHDYNHYCGCMHITLQPLLTQNFRFLMESHAMAALCIVDFAVNVYDPNTGLYECVRITLSFLDTSLICTVDRFSSPASTCSVQN